MTRLQFSREKSIEHGVMQREFSLEVNGASVPCVIWMPLEPARHCDVVIAMAHGGSQHKKTYELRMRAIHYAKTFGWISLAIDAPDHGDRISREAAEQQVLETAARVNGEPNAPSMSVDDKIRFLDEHTAQAVPEWKAALDALLGSQIVGARPALGFWGISMGSTIGIPLLAEDRRFKCAVLGLAELHPLHQNFRKAAELVRVPLRFIFQWDDLIRNRQYGIDLYDAFGSEEKSMHINQGGHIDYPAVETDSWEVFFKHHLL